MRQIEYLLLALLLGTSNPLMGQAVGGGKVEFLAQFEKVQGSTCVLVDTKNIICHVKGSNALFHLQVQGQSVVSTKPIFELPQEEGSKARLRNLSAQMAPHGHIMIAWSYRVDYTGPRSSLIQVAYIDLLDLSPDGRVEHHRVKRFSQGIFDLRAFVLGPKDVQFFYTDYSEKYFSPIADTGDKAKIWTLRWRDGKVTYDKKINRKGRFQVMSYAVASHANGTFDIAWEEFRTGIFGSSEKIKIAKLELDNENKYQFKELGSARVSRRTGWLDIVSSLQICPMRDIGSYILAGSFSRERGDNSYIYRKISLAGEVIADFPLSADVSIHDCNPDTGLFRYIRADPLALRFQRKERTAILGWTDFVSHSCEVPTVFPAKQIDLEQPPGDCYYWLEPTPTKQLRLKSSCRADCNKNLS